MADALASGASVRKDVGVQVPPRAPYVVTHLSKCVYDRCGLVLDRIRILNKNNFFTSCTVTSLILRMDS